jgi:hypothetical protein
MAAYYTNELAFDLPDVGFVDRTAIDLDAELPNGDALGILIVREPMPPGKRLREAVSEHLRREATRLGGYAVLDHRETSLGDAPAIEVSTRWRHQSGAVFYTREAHVEAHGVRLVLTMTTIFEAREACDEHVEQMLSTLRLREPD